MTTKIFPVILSGGSGSRLWPLSRESFPKQLLALAGEKSMLQETALRVADPALFHPLMVIANHEHRFSLPGPKYSQLRLSRSVAAVSGVVREPRDGPRSEG